MKKRTQRGVLALAWIAAAGFAAGTWSMQASAADVEKGQEKADQVCAACHGKDGNTPIDPSYPKLGGQYRDYLERALIEYRTGHRKNPIMAGQAQALTRADVANVAAYYAQLPSQLSVHPR